MLMRKMITLFHLFLFGLVSPNISSPSYAQTSINASNKDKTPIYRAITTPNDFITVWDTSKPTTRPSATSLNIAFPGIGENYTLTWKKIDGSASGSVLVTASSVRNPYILTFPSAGIYRVTASQGIGYFNGFSMVYNRSHLDI